MTLPKPVIDAVREGRAFLFLGAGASIGAVHPKSINPPVGQQLAEKIAEKFLEPQFIDRPLSQVAELAISEHDLFTVQEFIASLFRDFYPADFHKLLPKFVWRGIATTNYDLIIERAYDDVKKPLQHPIVFKKDGERIEEKLRSPNSLMLLKLHGCITDINDINTPLILTPDQYISHKRGRTRLFEKLQNFAYEYPFIFIGSSLGDVDIRAILQEINQLGDAKPRSYIVTPNMTPAEVKFWEGRKITHIQKSFKEFLNELDSSTPSNFRVLSTISDKPEHPIYKRFAIAQHGAIEQGTRTDNGDSPTAFSPNLGIDFVLLTALAEEQDAVLTKLPGYRKLPPSEDDIRTCFQAELTITFPDGSNGLYNVIIMSLLGMGRVQAVAATSDAIRRWHPRYILLVGIAGGMTTSDIQIGDILISDQIVDYEQQKLTPQGPEVRWSVLRADSRLLDACRNFRGNSWQEFIQTQRPNQGEPKCHIGTIVSGDKVIAFGEFLEKYHDVWPKLIGVEMEAAGVATAADQSPDKPGFFMVRGVSDLADENKNSADVEKWRAYARDAAASFAIALLKSGPVPLSTMHKAIIRSDQSQRGNFPSDTGISESLKTFLSRDVEFIHSEYKTEQADPKAFYKGYFVDWSPIVSNLDVKRSLTDTILAEVFLASEEERREICEFFVLKGHAGSGKSIILKRLAWEASVEFDKLCLFSKQTAFIDFESISELYRLSKERIFLFVDPVTEFTEVIDEIIPKARKEKIPLTIIGAERQNEWNISCSHLDVHITGLYELPYLNEKEIEGLIQLLTKHNSLGYLQGKTLEEQKEALRKIAGRQLLVALHEATLGKPFSDIVFDEYNSISSRRAQSLYLTVCIFNRLGVPVRAGLISRIHGIPFSEFSEQLFKPLEYIVFAQMNELIRDYEYRTRHPHIAEIVFERVLVDAQDRFDEYLRIIQAIDIDYSAEREAFKGITNAKELSSLFRNPQMIRQIYSAAHNRYLNNPMLFQQEAIFEMHSPNGSLDKATDLLQRALKLAPYNKAIAHSLSELALKKAENSTSVVEKQKYLQESKRIAHGLIKTTYTAHPYQTLFKVELSELEELIASSDEASIERKIKEVEKELSTAIQIFPDDSYIRDIEAKFCDLVNNQVKALNALEKAFAINKRSSYIATRLSKVYDASGRLDDAIKVLRECLDANPSEKHVNFQVAMLLQRSPNSNKAEIRHYLRRAFTIGDNNLLAQFWYARLLYLEGELDQSKDLFTRLGSTNIDNQVKNVPRGTVMENDNPKRFSGIVSNVEASYAFIIRDTFQDKIFTHSKFHDEIEWRKLSYHKRVTFDLAFNYRGPCALNISLE